MHRRTLTAGCPRRASSQIAWSATLSNRCRFLMSFLPTTDTSFPIVSLFVRPTGRRPCRGANLIIKISHSLLPRTIYPTRRLVLTQMVPVIRPFSPGHRCRKRTPAGEQPKSTPSSRTKSSEKFSHLRPSTATTVMGECTVRCSE